MKIRHVILAVGALASAAAAASAATQLLIDVNGLAAQATLGNGSNGFGGLTHTGAITLTKDSNSVLAGVAIDGVNQATTPGLTMAFTGVINLINGQVAGGSFNISLSDGSSYVASIASGVGAIATQAGQGFQIDGLTFAGFFGDNGQPAFVDRFAGVDIGPWAVGEPLAGSFLNFAFRPDAGGRDSDADADIFVVTSIPAPMAATAGAFGLAAVAGVRRRRVA